VSNILAVAGPNSRYSLPDAQPAGFLAGFWHGLISPLTFLISLFTTGVRIYEVHNNGRWYEFGFLLGVSGAFGGGGTRVVR
jgi:hypothetical protein